MPDQTPSTKLHSVQALRGVAAFLVLIFHMAAMFADGTALSTEFGAFWASGYAGVDMFFVISGFIMVYVTRDIAPSLKSAGRFLYARIARIYPLWWVFSGLMMLYFWLTYGQPAAPNKVVNDAVMPHLLKSLALVPQHHDPVLGLGWTLIHEMLFYILFAAGLLLPRKFLPYWLALWAALIVGGAFMVEHNQHARNYLQLFTHPLNLEFILGAGAGLWLTRGLTRENARASGLFLWVGLALFVIALLVYVPIDSKNFNWMRAAFYGVPSAMIILGAVWLEQQGRLRTPAFLARMGDWSYSLYLVHFLVLLALRRIWLMSDGYLPDALKWGAEGSLDNIAYILVAIMGSLIAAWISYHAIERTSLRLLRRKSL